MATERELICNNSVTNGFGLNNGGYVRNDLAMIVEVLSLNMLPWNLQVRAVIFEVALQLDLQLEPQNIQLLIRGLKWWTLMLKEIFMLSLIMMKNRLQRLCML